MIAAAHLGDATDVAKVVSTILSPGGALVGAALKPSSSPDEEPKPSVLHALVSTPDPFFWGSVAALGALGLWAWSRRRRTKRRR